MWRYSHASVTGSSHNKSGKPCQDFSSCTILKKSDGLEVLVAVASDGAGSAQCSEIGSELICSLFLDEMKAYLETGNDIKDLSRDFYIEWLLRFQQEISVRATGFEKVPRDFACTFLSAVISKDCAVFAQIGDGAIVVDAPDEDGVYMWEFWPQQGEYENMTYFATELNAHEKLQFGIHTGRNCHEVAIFTDGLQRLALHYQTQSAYSPFFKPFFAELRSQTERNSDKYTASLVSFLDSDQVNGRTDDDKTLILATRRTTPSELTSYENTD